MDWEKGVGKRRKGGLVRGCGTTSKPEIMWLFRLPFLKPRNGTSQLYNTCKIHLHYLGCMLLVCADGKEWSGK